ncbi:hypothetical protein [Streptomyces sp. SP18BB07]|uniref:hypothetical protein n=1 Tax=Streptomyces sp. SP18BB07 TaxID=3002522 RepID=UPI002E76A09D|nr:hypothetical protein [Streptomyces sp. SP18BB07]MEE1764446.1 hypothetical protein [Streptomyces sp. SP18BB07]
MSDSFATTYAPLVEQIRAAREQRDERAERLALEVLLKAYERLGNREFGTVEEQNAYIVARHLGVLPEVLQDLGLSPEDVPMPGRQRRAPPGQAGKGTALIAERFAHIGPADEQPAARFTVADRPEDNMRYQGRLLPYAVIDTRDGLPIAWYWDRDWAETTADTASRLRSTD